MTNSERRSEHFSGMFEKFCVTTLNDVDNNDHLPGRGFISNYAGCCVKGRIDDRVI